MAGEISHHLLAVRLNRKDLVKTLKKNVDIKMKMKYLVILP